MSYTVGLDFGTHQTKVCIEDASNPAQKIYEFVEFSDLKGNSSVLLPSIVQINQDDTLSYGFTDVDKCKTSSAKLPEPTLKLPEKPILELPKRPNLLSTPTKPPKPELKGHSIKDQIKLQEKYNKEVENWENACMETKRSNAKSIEEWEDECHAIKNDYDNDCDEYSAVCEKAQKQYEQEYKKWQNNNQPKKQTFRYFKLATFTNQSWPYNIKPELISTWYLTFVLFKVREKIGVDFFTQMGVPYSIVKIQSVNQQKLALKILVAANKLMDYFEKLELFLNAKIHELNEITSLTDYKENDLISYGLNVLPEAFAGLSSITQQGKLGMGMHLLTDIGGGTTDIAFFTITTNKLPDVHAVVSFPKGLNYIFEEYMQSNNQLSLEEIQSDFSASQTGFEHAIRTYQTELNAKASQLITQIENEFNGRRKFHGLPISRLRKALEKRPIVFCGGGSMYDSMRMPLHSFTDIMLIDKDILSIPHVKNTNLRNHLYPILATSYGLSIPSENEMKMTRIEEVFAGLPEKYSETDNNAHNEHGLLDD
jgi:hypothetical protein